MVVNKMAMESIADAMANRLDVKKYQELTDKILENPEIQIFIQDNDFEPAQVTKSLSKFNEYLKEKGKQIKDVLCACLKASR